MTSLWQFPQIRNIPAPFFFFFSNVLIAVQTITHQGKTSLTKFTKWFLVMPYKVHFFFKQMALQFIFWTLLSTQQDVVSTKTRNAQIHSWLSRSVAPSVFSSVSFSLHHCWEAWFLGVKTWYSYQCPKDFFFFFKTDLIFVYLCVSLRIHFQNFPFSLGIMKWSIKGILKDLI